MNPPAPHRSTLRTGRRHFLAGTVAAAGMAANPGPNLTTAAPVEGPTSAGRLRIGLIGCGGRGTGAAAQAAAADPRVTITAIGDLFADQVAEAADRLSGWAGEHFACPSSHRFVGPHAWRRVLESDLDLVILATSPDQRPRQVEAAVESGRHVYCEAPAAVDAAGVAQVLAAAGQARGRGLSFASGLCWRHDPATAAAMARIHQGAIGLPLRATVHAAIGLEWVRPARAGWTHAAWRTRNWISFPELSGGPLVERQVHAIDRALWALGDAELASAHPTAAWDSTGRTEAVRLVFTDGRSIDAAIQRGPRGLDHVVEVVHGTSGSYDLRAASPPRRSGLRPHEAAMRAAVATVLAGGRSDEGPLLCRATAAALMGSAAARTGRVVPWREFDPSQAVQSRLS